MSMTLREVVDVGRDEVVLRASSRPRAPLVRDALHVAVAAAEQFVGAVLDPRR